MSQITDPATRLMEMAEAMRELAQRADIEVAHSKADQLLIDTIRVLAGANSRWAQDNAEEIIETFENMDKWYG